MLQYLSNFIGNISTILDGVLVFFYGITGDYACSLILFAVLIKVSLLYFSNLQYKSMAAMKRIQPEVKKLQEKYKKDPMKLNEETMALWKKYNVNPAMGCLPLLIQMPILYALYRTISNFSGEFVTAKFLWIGSIAADKIPKIPFNIPFLGDHIPLIGSSLAVPDLPLVILYGLSMYLSQKLSMASASDDGKQKYTSLFMSVFITIVMYKFQSALILYWLVYNLLSIAEQHLWRTLDKSEEKVDKE